MSTTRSEALEARRRAVEAQRKADAAALRAADTEKNIAALERTPALFVCRDGIMLNSGEVGALCTSGTKFTLSGPSCKLGGWGEFPGWDCFPASGIIDLMNRGSLGISNMGKLELVRIESLADLDGEPGRLIGYVSPQLVKGGFKIEGAGTIEEHFVRARSACIAASGNGGDAAGPQGVVGESAWAAVDGEPGRGAVADVRQAVPFEVLVHYAGEQATGTILAVRSLKYERVASPDLLAPFALTFDPSTGELLRIEQLDCVEAFRPRLADMPPIRVVVDMMGRQPVRIELAEATAPIQEPAEE
jgi:hypothetical protein